MVRWLSGLMLLCGSVASIWAQGNVAERYLLAAANQERAARGIAPLAWDSALALAAVEHARLQAAHRSISHQFSGEMELSERGAAAGARFSLIAENVAEAPMAGAIQDAWMRSAGHRENLLDPKVDSVGIAVVLRDGQLYAVEDFARSTRMTSFEEQEAAVGMLVERAGLRILQDSNDARLTCGLDFGYRGVRRPGMTLRYTAAALDRLPGDFVKELDSGRYREAAVGACEDRGATPFSGYRIAILLYR